MNLLPVPAGCRAVTTGIAIALSLTACAIPLRTSRFSAPPPPAAHHDLEEPAVPSTVLASRFSTPVRSDTKRELLAVFANWRDAWRSRDFDAYLAHYASAYSGHGTPALRWQTRRLRMVQGKTAQAVLDFGEPELAIDDDGRAMLSFSQHFTDGELAEIGTKQWQLRQIDGRWLIEQEIFERRAK